MADLIIVGVGIAVFLGFAFAILHGVAMDDRHIRETEAELKAWINTRQEKR